MTSRAIEGPHAQVPLGWRVVPLKRLAGEDGLFSDGDWVETPYITDHGVRLIQTGNIGIGIYKEQGFRYISDSSFNKLDCTEVMAGDVLICRLADPVGRACLAPNLYCRMITSVDVAILRPSNAGCDSRYVVYYLSSDRYLGYLQAICRGGTRDRVSRSMLGDIPLLLPSLGEQQRIAAFLDRKTAAIDQLIQKKERLIELLQEKRQALITQAVTKGLDVSVPMKDSEVEWLGKIPAHWRVRRLKHQMAQVVDCPHSTPEYSEGGGYPAVRTSDLDRGRLNLATALRVSEDVYWSRIERLVPVENDILYSREGERFGMAALVPPEVRLCLGQRMMLFRPRAAASPAYQMWVLNSQAVYEQVKQDTVGATSPRINIPTITNAYVPVPPTQEQEAIAGYIGKVQVQLDGCTEAIGRSLAQLADYRQALISAAVTGQIDVTREAA